VYPWARQLVGDDFWDGLGAPFGGAEITVTVELTGFHTDPKAKALLSHCVISQEPLVARLTYCYRPRAGVAPADAKPGRLRRLSLWWQSWKRLDRRRIEKYRQQYLYRCPGSACRHRLLTPQPWITVLRNHADATSIRRDSAGDQSRKDVGRDPRYAVPDAEPRHRGEGLDEDAGPSASPRTRRTGFAYTWAGGR
jgi:hypothetical protein